MVYYPVINGDRLGQETLPPAQGTPQRVRGTGVQVMDAGTGAFIEGAEVSVITPNGAIFTKKTTGPEGKAMFGEAELPEFDPANPFAYQIAAEGYDTQENFFIPRDIVPFQMEKASGPLGIPLWGWLAGIVVVSAGVMWWARPWK